MSTCHHDHQLYGVRIHWARFLGLSATMHHILFFYLHHLAFIFVCEQCEGPVTADRPHDTHYNHSLDEHQLHQRPMQTYHEDSRPYTKRGCGLFASSTCDSCRPPFCPPACRPPPPATMWMTPSSRSGMLALMAPSQGCCPALGVGWGFPRGVLVPSPGACSWQRVQRVIRQVVRASCGLWVGRVRYLLFWFCWCLCVWRGFVRPSGAPSVVLVVAARGRPLLGGCHDVWTLELTLV